MFFFLFISNENLNKKMLKSNQAHFPRKWNKRNKNANQQRKLNKINKENAHHVLLALPIQIQNQTNKQPNKQEESWEKIKTKKKKLTSDKIN